ncbi:MAG: hypothetical protein AAF827_00005 [Cyanobacteria bacterium P01_D01_bin.6]
MYGWQPRPFLDRNEGDLEILTTVLKRWEYFDAHDLRPLPR